MKNIKVFEGHELKVIPPSLSTARARCRLAGTDVSGKPVAIPLDDELFSQHILFLGGIGTGKTNAIFQIVGQLRRAMTENDVMLIFDTKGDYYAEFYRPGDIVISNDDKATGPTGPDFWNTLLEIGEGDSMEADLIEIAHTLFFEKIQRSSQPFFPNAARQLFEAILLHFVRSGDQAEMNNAGLREFFNRSGSADVRAVLQAHNDLKAMASYIANDASPQTQGVMSELQQIVREIFVGNFRKVGSLSVREAIRAKGGRAIFIEYDLGSGNALTPIYRLLLDLALKEALRREKSEGNVWFVIDEFRLVPNLQHVDDAVNFGRSLGVKFIIGVQNAEQVFYAYEETLGRSLLSGFMTTMAFRVNDAATRGFIQGIFGRNRKHEAYTPVVQTRGIVEQVREANVVEDWDIASLPVGRAIIGLPGQEPFLFQFERYRH